MVWMELIRTMAELVLDSAMRNGRRSVEQEMSEYFEQQFPSVFGKQAAAR